MKGVWSKGKGRDREEEGGVQIIGGPSMGAIYHPFKDFRME